VPHQDADLIARLRAGDGEAFERLVRDWSGWVHAVAVRILRDDEDARDVAQQAFLALHRSLRRFEERSALSTWLYRIVANLSLASLRSRRRRRTDLLDDLPPDAQAAAAAALPWFEAPEWSRGAEERLARAEQSARVRRLVRRLPRKYRQVVELRDLEDCDTRETARRLGLTETAVKSRLHRARQQLRSHLDPMALGLPL
jgi:RNA polymerase sigma-70 factor (ECF subfamily)